MRSIFAFAFLMAGAAVHAQSLTARGDYRTYDEGFNLIVSESTSEAGTDAPVGVDDGRAFVAGASLYTGTTRAVSDYGLIRLFSQTQVDVREAAAFLSRTETGGSFFDPLTIQGGTAGGVLSAQMRLEGEVRSNDGAGTGWGSSIQINVLVFNDATGFWEDAANQSVEYAFGPDPYLPWTTATLTMSGYDPARRYAISGGADVSTSVTGGTDTGSGSATVTYDATNTARLTGIGFVNGTVGSFVGASGTIYPSAAVPEPATLLALGFGVAALRRRRRA